MAQASNETPYTPRTEIVDVSTPRQAPPTTRSTSTSKSKKPFGEGPAAKGEVYTYLHQHGFGVANQKDNFITHALGTDEIPMNYTAEQTAQIVSAIAAIESDGNEVVPA
jgi:hypothetical protein